MRSELFCPGATIAEDQPFLAAVQDAQDVCGIRQAADVVEGHFCICGLGSRRRNHGPLTLR